MLKGCKLNSRIDHAAHPRLTHLNHNFVIAAAYCTRRLMNAGRVISRCDYARNSPDVAVLIVPADAFSLLDAAIRGAVQTQIRTFWPFILPMPEVATDPNGGVTYGVLPVCCS